MSLLNSVLGSLSPTRRPSSDTQHELPFYRSSSSSPSFPPPPVAASVYASPIPESKARVPDDLLAVQRKARHLEGQLQFLLDAQADGLMAGLGQGLPEDQMSTGSSTPTVSSIRRDASTGPKPLARRKPSLAAARRGIARRIQQLAAVKEEEAYLLDGDLARAKTIVHKTSRWERKRTGLEKKIRSIQAEDIGERTYALENEAKDLKENIKRLEDQLWAMKAKHRKVLDELSELENSVEAKISSYQASLSLLDSEIAKFLARPADPDQPSSPTSLFFSLPPKRRTLSMAREYWQDEQSRLEERYLEVDVDKAALEEGAALWNDVVHHVTEFEASLQERMQSDERGRALKRAKSPSTEPSEFEDLIASMDKTIGFLEEKLSFATSKNWNLLLCCIGAELEAFRQGRDLLDDTMAATLHPQSDGESSKQNNNKDSDSGMESPEELKTGSFPQARYFDHDTDEDPDPELLISHQDTDTD